MFARNKIVTVAGSGATVPSSGSLNITMPIAKCSQVHISHACKQRSIFMSDMYEFAYKSNTFNEKNNENELHTQKTHLDDDDNTLTIDEFLSSGTKKKH